jgi:mRNA interferase RelE/StbE
MALYKVLYLPSTEKDFKRVPINDLKKILQRIDLLAINPRPPGCKKLTG